MTLSPPPKSLPFLLRLSRSPPSSPSIARCFYDLPPQQQRQHRPFTRTTAPFHFSGENLDPERSLVSDLASCASGNDVSRGRKIHCRVLKSGLDSNTFICNSILNFYAKCGFVSDAEAVFRTRVRLDIVSFNVMLGGYVRSRRLEDARTLFDVMPFRNCVSYTTMIKGYAQNERWSEAMQLFREIRNAGIMVNDVTLASVISACSHLGGILDCMMLHCLTIKLQLERFVLVSTNLLHMYCTWLNLKDAKRLFDQMPDRNLVTWNVMLNGYSKAGLVELARELFDSISEKDIVSWGTMIDGYIRKQRLHEALLLYNEMLCNGVKPSNVMIVDLLSACGRSAAVREGLQLHGTIVKAGFDSYDFIQAMIIHFYAASGDIALAIQQFEVSITDHVPSRNAMIAGFVRNGMIEQAGEVFNDTCDKDVFSWSTMISGYAQSERPNLALELFQEMIASRVKPNAITMVSVFSAIASLGALNEGKRAHKYLNHSSIPLNDNLSAAVVDMYAKCGSINSALQVFYQIRDNVSTVSPWNTIICGLAMHGRASLALDLYSDLQKRPIKPNSITFIGVLSACCHAGIVQLGKIHFQSMRLVYKIDPDIKHYGCMVDLLGRAGKLEEAEAMIKSMPMKADVVIWGTLLAACRTHRNVDVAERAAVKLAELDPSHEGCRVLLSNIYADAGRWEDVASLRKEMQTESVERLSGFSGVV